MSSKKQYISTNVLLQVAFISIILLVLGVIVHSLTPFLPGFLGALCLFVLLLNPLKWLVNKRKWKKLPSVIALMLLSAVMIVGPLYLLIQMLTNKILVLFNNTNQVKEDINEVVEMLQTKFNIDILNTTNIERITQVAGKLLEKILNASLSMTMQLGVAFLILYFVLMNFDKIEKKFYELVPLKKSNLKEMNENLKDLVVSNAVAMPLTSFFQALVAYVGYLIFGVDDSFTWFVLTIFAAMIPVVGAALIYVPLVLLFFAKGDTTNATWLLIYCLVIVNFSDNLIRLVLQKQMADVHPLITIFGVVVGLDLFGFIGIVFGPILFSVFYWLVRLYKYEFIDDNPKD